VSTILGTEESVDGDFHSPPPSTKRTEERRRERKVSTPMTLAWVSLYRQIVSRKPWPAATLQLERIVDKSGTRLGEVGEQH
jgi:hypothetical protein